ncbi:MAG: hypothetical protein KDA28_01175, partial [Phycisphaerales bacterium]|nr:hypothetical protein [Phycisphaerales bacterium]
HVRTFAPDDEVMNGLARLCLGRTLLRDEILDEADAVLREAWGIFERTPPPNRDDVLTLASALADCAEARGFEAEAERWRQVAKE